MPKLECPQFEVGANFSWWRRRVEAWVEIQDWPVNNVENRALRKKKEFALLTTIGGDNAEYQLTIQGIAEGEKDLENGMKALERTFGGEKNFKMV